MTKILVGTSSWTDKTLIESGKFYPPIATTPEDRLRFYASQFPIVEIDSSYYGIPAIENAQRWVERTPPGFVFNIKTYRLFTRHQTPVHQHGEGIAGGTRPNPEEQHLRQGPAGRNQDGTMAAISRDPRSAARRRQ